MVLIQLPATYRYCHGNKISASLVQGRVTIVTHIQDFQPIALHALWSATALGMIMLSVWQRLLNMIRATLTGSSRLLNLGAKSVFPPLEVLKVFSSLPSRVAAGPSGPPKGGGEKRKRNISRKTIWPGGCCEKHVDAYFELKRVHLTVKRIYLIVVEIYVCWGFERACNFGVKVEDDWFSGIPLQAAQDKAPKSPRTKCYRHRLEWGTQIREIAVVVYASNTEYNIMYLWQY